MWLRARLYALYLVVIELREETGILSSYEATKQLVSAWIGCQQLESAKRKLAGAFLQIHGYFGTLGRVGT